MKHLLRRGGGGGADEDVLKKAHIFTGPLLRLLVNFRCPSKFYKIFNATPPPPPSPPEFGIEGVQSGILSYHRYNLKFLKMSDILKSMCMHASPQQKYRPAASFTSLVPDGIWHRL